MTAVPATRHRQEALVALEAPDAYVRVELPDGRRVVIYGDGSLNVEIGTQTRYHRVPTADDPVVSRRPTESTRRPRTRRGAH